MWQDLSDEPLNKPEVQQQVSLTLHITFILVYYANHCSVHIFSHGNRIDYRLVLDSMIN